MTTEKTQPWADASEAREAAREEREEGVWASIKTNRRAVAWSMVISMSIVMEGYDTSLLPSFYGYPTFAKKYGNYYPSIDEYQLTGAWQAGLSNAAIIGVIFGGLINGWASARYGYKNTMLVALAFLTAFIFIPFFAQSPEVLIVGEFLCEYPPNGQPQCVWPAGCHFLTRVPRQVVCPGACLLPRAQLTPRNAVHWLFADISRSM